MAFADTGLERFVQAQAPVYEAVRRELSSGRKTSHWMWFVFPQLRLLGKSATAKFFGLLDQTEAAAYFDHPLLGTRLGECAQLVLASHHKSACEIFGSPDDMKLRSSMTLFELAVPREPVFAQVLDRYYGGERDSTTLDVLAAATGRAQNK